MAQHTNLCAWDSAVRDEGQINEKMDMGDLEKNGNESTGQLEAVEEKGLRQREAE